MGNYNVKEYNLKYAKAIIKVDPNDATCRKLSLSGIKAVNASELAKVIKDVFDSDDGAKKIHIDFQDLGCVDREKTSEIDEIEDWLAKRLLLNFLI